MHDLLDTAPCGLLSFADDGTLTRVNATLLEMLGHERDEVMGRHYEDALLRAKRAAEGARAGMEARGRELERANEQLEAQTLELEHQQAQLQEQAAELEAASEELRVANEDLLARTEEAEQLREAAEEANRAKSAFLAVMSHELRTRLNAIGGYTEILEMGIHRPVTDAQREALERIGRRSSRSCSTCSATR